MPYSHLSKGISPASPVPLLTQGFRIERWHIDYGRVFQDSRLKRLPGSKHKRVSQMNKLVLEKWLEVPFSSITRGI